MQRVVETRQRQTSLWETSSATTPRQQMPPKKAAAPAPIKVPASKGKKAPPVEEESEEEEEEDEDEEEEDSEEEAPPKKGAKGSPAKGSAAAKGKGKKKEAAEEWKAECAPCSVKVSAPAVAAEGWRMPNPWQLLTPLSPLSLSFPSAGPPTTFTLWASCLLLAHYSLFYLSLAVLLCDLLPALCCSRCV